MKLKDIVPYCLKIKDAGYEHKYYWIINGLTYTIDSLQSYTASDFLTHNYNPKIYDNYINLSRYCFTNPNETKSKYDPEDNYLTLSLDNEITIFDRFILVHRTANDVTDCERKIFVKTNYYLANGHSASADHYTIGLYYTDPVLGGMANNLRFLFKDLISPPVPSKPVELTLDEKVDDLIDELMKENKVKAIKKLKRMLNERL